MPDFVKKEGEAGGDFRSDNRFLLGFFEEKDGALHYRYDAERVIIEPWGPDSLRVRASKMPEMPQECWALSEEPKPSRSCVEISEYSAKISNGRICAEVNNIGKITFFNARGKSFWRNTSATGRTCLRRPPVPWKWKPENLSRSSAGITS
jgi:alpha-D-xyloside xylohydrolase